MKNKNATVSGFFRNLFLSVLLIFPLGTIFCLFLIMILGNENFSMNTLYMAVRFGLIITGSQLVIWGLFGLIGAGVKVWDIAADTIWKMKRKKKERV